MIKARGDCYFCMYLSKKILINARRKFGLYLLFSIQHFVCLYINTWKHLRDKTTLSFYILCWFCRMIFTCNRGLTKIYVTWLCGKDMYLDSCLWYLHVIQMSGEETQRSFTMRWKCHQFKLIDCVKDICLLMKVERRSHWEIS